MRRAPSETPYLAKVLPAIAEVLTAQLVKAGESELAQGVPALRVYACEYNPQTSALRFVPSLTRADIDRLRSLNLGREKGGGFRFWLWMDDSTPVALGINRNGSLRPGLKKVGRNPRSDMPGTTGISWIPTTDDRR